LPAKKKTTTKPKAHPGTAMQTVQRRIADLKMADYNPRQITDTDMASLVNSIREFGFVEPVVVNKDNTVVGGHQRLRAAQQLSIEEVPVVYVDLPKKKEKILNLALNRIHGDWDMSKLSVVLEELKLGNGDELQMTGFSELEIGNLLAPDRPLEDEWEGMPEFHQEDKLGYRTVIVHLRDEQAVREFSQLMNQKLSGKTKYLWFPQAERNKTVNLRWQSES
jgi:ParB-like chromosome segregation protein Spo0J